MNCASKPRVISDDHNHNCNANVIESLGHLLALNPGIMFQIFSQFWRKKLQDKIWNEKRGFEARHLAHKWRTTITCYTLSENKTKQTKKTPPKCPFTYAQYVSLSLPVGKDILKHARSIISYKKLQIIMVSKYFIKLLLGRT